MNIGDTVRVLSSTDVYLIGNFGEIVGAKRDVVYIRFADRRYHDSGYDYRVMRRGLLVVHTSNEDPEIMAYLRRARQELGC